MKIINYLKLFLDILMLLVFALLFNTRVFSGLEFHETVGLALGGAFAIHLALNGRRVKQVTANLWNHRISLNKKIGYIVDVLLLLSMGFILVSGVMISKTILVGVLKASDNHLFQSLHIAVSYVSLLLIGIHVGLNWSWVINSFKRLFSITQKSSVLTKVGTAVVVLAVVFGSYTIYSENYLSKTSIEQSSVQKNQVSGELSGLGEIPLKGERGGGGRFRGGHQGSAGASIFSDLITHLGIISVFSVITFYTLKLSIGKI